MMKLKKVMPEEQLKQKKQEYKTVTIISINPIDPAMWKYAEEETARFYDILKNNPQKAFTHIFTNLKVEIKTIQIEV